MTGHEKAWLIEQLMGERDLLLSRDLSAHHDLLIAAAAAMEVIEYLVVREDLLGGN